MNISQGVALGFQLYAPSGLPVTGSHPLETARNPKSGPTWLSQCTELEVSEAPNPPPSRTPLLFGLAAALVALGFAAFTGHAWEDYYITFRASLNLAEGNGLVFQPGERVHSFTSPLGTLLPALFALGGGEGVAERALWGLRIVSALALGGALWIGLRAFQRAGIARIAAIAIGLAWLLDAKTVDFAINGMETALVVFFVAFTWQAFASGGRLWPVALGCTGLQWPTTAGSSASRIL